MKSEDTLVFLIVGLATCSKTDNLTHTEDASTLPSTTSWAASATMQSSTPTSHANEDSASIFTTASTANDGESLSEIGSGEVGDTPKIECETWNDLCLDDMKCVAHSNGDNCYMVLTHCVQVPDPPRQLYETCSVDADYCQTGIDNCARGLQCYEIDAVSLQGECYSRCTGQSFPEECVAPHTVCTSDSAQTLTVCQPLCSPLKPSCYGGYVCVASDSPPNEFSCLPGMREDSVATFGKCEASNACIDGHACADSKFAVECNDTFPRCCLPFCDTTKDNACPGMNQQCIPWFEPDVPLPSTLKNLGICRLPN